MSSSKDIVKNAIGNQLAMDSATITLCISNIISAVNEMKEAHTSSLHYRYIKADPAQHIDKIVDSLFRLRGIYSRVEVMQYMEQVLYSEKESAEAQ